MKLDEKELNKLIMEELFRLSEDKWSDLDLNDQREYAEDSSAKDLSDAFEDLEFHQAKREIARLFPAKAFPEELQSFIKPGKATDLSLYYPISEFGMPGKFKPRDITQHKAVPNVFTKTRNALLALYISALNLKPELADANFTKANIAKRFHLNYTGEGSRQIRVNAEMTANSGPQPSEQILNSLKAIPGWSSKDGKDLYDAVLAMDVGVVLKSNLPLRFNYEEAPKFDKKARQEFDPFEDLELYIKNNYGEELLKNFITALGGVKNKKEIAGLKENTSKLEPIDFDMLYKKFRNDPEYKLPTTPNKAEQLIKNLVNFYNGLEADTQLDLRDRISALIRRYREVGGLRATKGTESGYTIGSKAAAEGGKIDAQIVEAFASAYDGTTFKERLEQFKDYTNSVAAFVQDPKSNEIKGTISKKFSSFITLDLMQQILYDFEASSGGWVFESFLAFMAFGNAIGAGYGAGDFTIADSSAPNGVVDGSAKLLQKGKSSQNIENVNYFSPIRYVMGVKQTKAVSGAFMPTTQKDRTGQVLLYVFDIVKLKNDSGGDVAFAGMPNFASGLVGKKVEDLGYAEQERLLTGTKEELEWETANKRIKFKAFSQGQIGTLNLLFLQEADFSEYSDRIVQDINKELAVVMRLMASLRSNIDDYALNSEDAGRRSFHSKEALRNYSLLKSALGTGKSKKGLFGSSWVSKSRKTTKENKEISEIILDKLIQEVILKK